MRVRNRVGPKVLIGGVGYWWQRDASFGLVACEALRALDWPAHVEVAQLDYGAHYVAQDMAGAEPPYDRVILIAGVVREREPGKVYVSRWKGRLPDAEEIQERIREAGGGVVDIDHLLVVAQYFNALPDEVLLVEFEPVDAGGGEHLTPQADRLLPGVIARVRQEALQPGAVEVSGNNDGEVGYDLT